MAKRFTDTEKWRDEWYGSLTNDYRIIWQYLLDSCSIAGIFKKDFRLLNFQCNTKISEEDFFQVFEGRVLDCGKFVFLPKFLKFQYPKGLTSNKPALVSVRKELEQNNLINIVKELLGNDYLIIKDKDKDKDKVKDTDKGKDKEEKQNSLKIESVEYSEMQGLLEIKAMVKRIDISTVNMTWKEFVETNKDAKFEDLSHVKRMFGKFIDGKKFDKLENKTFHDNRPN